MFVVRYDHDRRAFLSNHTDDADISINILLNTNFEGGGTRFWNREEEQPFAHVKPTKMGQMVTHSAKIHHEGMPTTKGTRYILVGFLSVDRIDPFSGTYTGLSPYASWLSLNWMATKFHEGYSSSYKRITDTHQSKWTNNPLVRGLFFDMTNALRVLGDAFASHHVETLVQEEDANDFMKALDEGAISTDSQPSSSSRASWFRGQQVYLDIDGSITDEWATRVENKNRFMEL